MAKPKTIYICNNCGFESPKWMGKCSSCNEWNTFQEEVRVKPTGSEAVKNINQKKSGANTYTLDQIPDQERPRIFNISKELNNVLGGGFVSGSVLILAGEPGVGKSTLMLQTAFWMDVANVMYVSGEESLHQVKLRAQRLNLKGDHVQFVTSTNTGELIPLLEKAEPTFVIIDSIQSLSSPFIDALPGSISQIKYCATELIQFAKSTGTTILIIGHINKEGAIAGPKILEHMVDTVMYFEGDLISNFRLLRCRKNRFGNTAELGIFEMTSSGLTDVENPSSLWMNEGSERLSGVATGTSVEGSRSIMLECQALVSKAVYGNPQRSVTGYDLKRLNMLLAVLDKRAGYHFAQYDVFVNITGGMKIIDPAIDLAILAALTSSYLDQDIPSATCLIGEIGLSGEIRNVNRLEQRINEAKKLGFDRVIVPDHSKNDALKADVKLVKVKSINQLIPILFN